MCAFVCVCVCVSYLYALLQSRHIASAVLCFSCVLLRINDMVLTQLMVCVCVCVCVCHNHRRTVVETYAHSMVSLTQHMMNTHTWGTGDTHNTHLHAYIHTTHDKHTHIDGAAQVRRSHSRNTR